MQYWLMKSEPSSFSVDDLKKCSRKTNAWDGMRNFQARNMLKNEMKKGDLAFFYHSSCDPAGIVGIVEIVKEGYPDFTALDPENHHYDPKATSEKPIWYMVDVKLKEKFDQMITLKELRENPKLKEMILLRKGNRLSIMQLSKTEWTTILKMKVN